jgi:hypothetical protein
MEGNRWFRSRAEARVKAEISVVCDDGMRQWRPMALGQGWRASKGHQKGQGRGMSRGEYGRKLARRY